VDFDQNPECALGVIFDSDREFQVPSRASPDVANRGADTIHGTKLTVMLGGHYWDGLPESFLPSPADAVEMAKRVVERHLRLDPSLTQQAVASTKLCRNCIPQHVVGHGKRMWDAHGELEWAFKGRLAVAGQSYTPPGVLGSVRAARDVAMQIGGAWRGPNNIEESVEAIDDEEERARIKGIIKAHGGVAEWLGTSELKPSLSVGDTGLARFGKTKFVAVPKVLLPLRFNAPDQQDDEDIVKK
jgi:oxygen-dependent protoporphyrinogen oxidase